MHEACSWEYTFFKQRFKLQWDKINEYIKTIQKMKDQDRKSKIHKSWETIQLQKMEFVYSGYRLGDGEKLGNNRESIVP